MHPDDEVTLFAKTNYRNKQVPFGIKRDDRRKHMYIVGKTGMGKTNMIENMIIQDIHNGHGVCFVDPNGDAVEKILRYVPANRVNDVIYINPADMDFPIAFNILESVDPRYKHLVASGLMGVFTKIWANLWSARMEYILNNCILALLDSPGNTLLGISRMLVDKKYRKRIVDNVKDPIVRSFWQDEFANWNEKYRNEAIAPIQNKVGQFLSSGIIRNIVGQPKSTIDLRTLMDNKKILLLNLSKGKVGEDNSALLGAMIITKLQLAAFSRADIPEEDRKDFYLYVDEFQNFATESFATILSEARKYRLNLIIAHQYIGQLVQEKNTKVRDAVFGNVGTIVTFRIGAADAEFLEQEFEPTFIQNDLVNIPKHTVILKLMINGISSDPFTAETLPPTTFQATGNEEKIIRVSRERYANPVMEVEGKITKWMGQEFHETSAAIASDMKFEHQEEDEEELVIQQDSAAETTEQSATLNESKAENPDRVLSPEPVSIESMQAFSAEQEIAKQDKQINQAQRQQKTMQMNMAAEAPRPQRKNDDRRTENRRQEQRPEQGQRQGQNQQNNNQRNNPNNNQNNNQQKQNNQNKGGKPKENPIWEKALKKDQILIKEIENLELQLNVAKKEQRDNQDQQNNNSEGGNSRAVLKPGQSVKIDE